MLNYRGHRRGPRLHAEFPIDTLEVKFDRILYQFKFAHYRLL